MYYEQSVMETAIELLEPIYETSIGDIKSFRKKVDRIKNARPDSQDAKEASDFVNKHYNDLIQLAEYAENEPKIERDGQIKQLVAIIVACVGCCMLPGLGMLIGSTLIYIAIIVNMIIVYIKSSEHTQVVNDLTKIKKSLERVDKSKLSAADRKKLNDIIDKIDDAENENFTRIKN